MRLPPVGLIFFVEAGTYILTILKRLLCYRSSPCILATEIDQTHTTYASNKHLEDFSHRPNTCDSYRFVLLPKKSYGLLNSAPTNCSTHSTTATGAVEISSAWRLCQSRLRS